MSDPLTALMYAVQVMNFLKTLIIRTLREREESVVESTPISHLEPSDENGHESSSQPSFDEPNEEDSKGNGGEKVFVVEEPALDSPPQLCQDDSTTESGSQSFLASIENIPGGNLSLVDNCPCEVVSQVKILTNEHQDRDFTCKSVGIQTKTCKSKTGQSSNSNLKRGSKRVKEQSMVKAAGPVDKSKGTGVVGRITPRMELFEAWR